MTELLNVNNVTKRFGGLTAVHDVTITLLEDEILGLIGPNGAGKTTLFNVVSGTFPPTEGVITFDARSIIGLPRHRISRMGIARTFQIVKPFSKLTAVENVMVGAFLRTNNTQHAENRAREIVDFVGLSRFADRPAHTLTISGRKRLELGRALATEPRLLLLDEVMAGLTPTESAAMVELIRQIRETGVTLLVIEHVMKAIMSLSDRVVVLHHGERIAMGTPEEIVNDEKVIEAYLGEEYQLAEAG